MKILFALPGFHRIDRGAEVALISVAKELAKSGDMVTLIGSGSARPGTPYRFVQAKCIGREKFRSFPSIPLLRNDCVYEELTYLPELLFRYRPADYDITLTCSYPFTNWALRRLSLRGHRPPHVFVTENGDWPSISDSAEYRFFGCDGLVCTNPDFYERNRTHWNCQLIPNGIDCERFKPGESQRHALGLPKDKLIVLMVSALAPSKRVGFGIETISRVANVHLVVAGDGPLRREIETEAERLMEGRFTRISIPAEQMPALYQSADIFLHLSKKESFGNVFLEALACGLPIVAHDSSRLRWIVGDDQFLVDTSDQSAIITAISAAAAAPLAKRQDRIARASSFSWSKVGNMYRDFLEQVIKTYRKKSGF
jgi:glycosyltransferase involved in cell wall biosynthesis